MLKISWLFMEHMCISLLVESQRLYICSELLFKEAAIVCHVFLKNSLENECLDASLKKNTVNLDYGWMMRVLD